MPLLRVLTEDVLLLIKPMRGNDTSIINLILTNKYKSTDFCLSPGFRILVAYVSYCQCEVLCKFVRWWWQRHLSQQDHVNQAKLGDYFYKLNLCEIEVKWCGHSPRAVVFFT